MPPPTASRSTRGARSPGEGPTSAATRSSHLGGLRQDGVSYIFAGEQELDLGLALEILNRELGLERLLLEGGGGSNGAFLRAGLIDEISLAICPAVDGAKGAPSIFDSSDEDAGIAAPIRSMTLASCEALEGGAVWLRYRLQTYDAQQRGRGPPGKGGPLQCWSTVIQAGMR